MWNAAVATLAHSTVTEFDGGSHLTLISHPDAVAAVIVDAAQTVSRSLADTVDAKV